MPKNVHDWCTERGISLEELAEQSGLDLGKVFMPQHNFPGCSLDPDSVHSYNQ